MAKWRKGNLRFAGIINSFSAKLQSPILPEKHHFIFSPSLLFVHFSILSSLLVRFRKFVIRDVLASCGSCTGGFQVFRTDERIACYP